MELNGPSCGKLSGKQEANMNWIKCTDMNKQPIYVNIENATSIFWIEKEKGIHHRIPQWRGQHKGHRATRSHH